MLFLRGGCQNWCASRFATRKMQALCSSDWLMNPSRSYRSAKRLFSSSQALLRPQLADIDRKMALAFGAWVEMRQRLASYNAVASAPWIEASKRFLETISATGTSETPIPDWREAFAKWSEISNEELIRNQRTDGFLQAQKELLQAGLQLRSRQDDVAEAASAMFGLPTRKDFDDVTRQLTELRREVRALARQRRDQKIEGAR